MVNKRALFDAQASMQEQLDGVSALKRAADDECAALEETLFSALERDEQLQLDLSGATSTIGKLDRVVSYFNQLRADGGLRDGRMSVPPREPDSPASAELGRQHMAAVLRGRGEGDNINLVADALHRAGYLERLFREADRCQPFAKAVAKEAVTQVQNHWTARHAVHVWDRLELSRSQMETLRHLLSHVYNPEADAYVPIRAWENPNDATDFVFTASLASRYAREREFAAIAAEQNIVVSSSGRCERDAIECTRKLYSNYAPALRKIYDVKRPATPVLFLDGTGGALGRGITHGEIGCADFIAVGDSDARQSRATLLPLFLYEGTDHTGDLRSSLELAITSYNRLVELGYFWRYDPSDPDGAEEQVPCRSITAADMQGAKSTYGMASCSHSVWCTCQRGEKQTLYPDKPMESYTEMKGYIEGTVGCRLKTFEDMCSWAHFSPSVAKGGRFTPFVCSCCGYAPTQAQWRRDLQAYSAMTDKDQKAAQAAHRNSGDEMNSTFQHFHQELFTPPLPHHGMDRCGVDNLHLNSNLPQRLQAPVALHHP